MPTLPLTKSIYICDEHLKVAHPRDYEASYRVKYKHNCDYCKLKISFKKEK